MPGVLVQSDAGSQTQPASSYGHAFASNVTVGNIGVAIYQVGDHTQVPTWSDNLGNTWSTTGITYVQDTNNNNLLALAVCHGFTTGGACTVTATASSGSPTYWGAYLAEFSGLSTAAIAGMAGQMQNHPNSATNGITTGNITTSSACTIVALCFSTNLGGVAAVGTGYTGDPTNNPMWFSPKSAIVEYQTGVAAGTVAATFTGANGTADYVCVAIALPETGSNTGTVPGTGSVNFVGNNPQVTPGISTVVTPAVARLDDYRVPDGQRIAVPNRQIFLPAFRRAA